MEGPRFTWGDTVRVATGALQAWRPGAIAEVVGFREVDTPAVALELDAAIGSTLYLVEFSDGSSLEIPEAAIEAAEEQ